MENNAHAPELPDLQGRALGMLRAERERQHLTQMEVALRMGITLSVLNKIERGARGQVKLATLQRYADALGCHLDIQLLRGSERT